MSAALLRNNDKCNELEDNQESCLHDALTWTALRFTNHTISGNGTSRFLRAFDEQYEDEEGVRGGDLKKGFLLGRDIPHVVKFDGRPQLNALIRELTEAFAVRYEEPPSANQFDVLNQMRSSNVPSSFLEENTAFKYQKHLDDLVARNWLVDVFRRYLDTNPWPSSDQSHGQLIGTGSNKKRAREQGKLEQRIPHSKSQRFSDGIGSQVPSDDEEVD